MHYDAITHTQRAIRNLQSEVRLFLRKHEEQGLPYINKRHSLMIPKQLPLTVRSNRHRSQFQSPSNAESPQKKIPATISYDQIQQPNRVNVVILKPRVKRKSRIILPSFEKSRQLQKIDSKHSVQLMQIALVQEQSQPNFFTDEIPRPQKSPQPQKPTFIAKIPRYSKSNICSKKKQAKTMVMQKYIESKVSKTLDLEEDRDHKRVQCYSPWQMKTDHEDLYQAQENEEQF